MEEFFQTILNGFAILGLMIIMGMVLLCFKYIFNHENEANSKNSKQDGPDGSGS